MASLFKLKHNDLSGDSKQMAKFLLYFLPEIFFFQRFLVLSDVRLPHWSGKQRSERVHGTYFGRRSYKMLTLVRPIFFSFHFFRKQSEEVSLGQRESEQKK